MTAAASWRPTAGPAIDDGGLTHTARRLCIDSGPEPVIYLHRDSQLCRSEGFESERRVWVRTGSGAVLATLNVVTDGLVRLSEVGLSESAWARLHATEGSVVEFAHPLPLESLAHVRAKIHGQRLDAAAIDAVIQDIAAGNYSDLHLAAFLTACAGDRLDREEIGDLTRAMTASGERLHWARLPAMDKHSVGGLPGNRTTLLVVPIVTAAGVLMPKTSSRAITSPAGTADTMEMLAPVDLDLPRMRRVVDQEGGCIVWGGTARLSPADDVLIRVERALDLDSAGQLVASVLSKKAAAGATHVVIDIPVGPTAKVRSFAAAQSLCGNFCAVGAEVGLQVLPVLTDGTQPVGHGIGPALEARDALAVLQGNPEAPRDLRERSLLLAGHILEFSGTVSAGGGQALAREILGDGRAWAKFQAICRAQGGMREPP
ncbi:MAG TPA: thymidine phosphorylase family protein, partial [Gemmatimonadales bacterium]|nr:thymidine phosphorylase family protein [Gemmatimonadales bacterium]